MSKVKGLSFNNHNIIVNMKELCLNPEFLDIHIGNRKYEIKRVIEDYIFNTFNNLHDLYQSKWTITIIKMNPIYNPKFTFETIDENMSIEEFKELSKFVKEVEKNERVMLWTENTLNEIVNELNNYKFIKFISPY